MRENTSLEDGVTVALSSSELVPDPVFVDDTGKRRRRIRIAFYAIGGVSLTYAGLVAVSLLGGPLKPESIIPFPQTFNRPAANTPAPMTGQAARLATKTARPTTPRPSTGTSGKPGASNPANPLVVQPLKPGGPAPATPTPEVTPTPTPTPTPSPNAPTPTPTPPPPTETTTAPAGGQAGGQGGGQGGGNPVAQGGQPEDTSTGTVTPIQTTPVAAPAQEPTAAGTSTGTGTGTPTSNPTVAETMSPAAPL